ncbi:MAG: glycosyltransferase [Lentisphaerae bacterium]|nr:glycosyltransferase [Lentisphaerota bacterium]
MNTAQGPVIMVTHSLSRRAGGLYFSVRRLAQSIHDLGVSTRVLGLADADAGRDRAAWLPLKAEAFATAGPAGLGYAPGLFRALDEAATPGAVMHLHGLWKLPSLAVLRTARKRRVPAVISPSGMLDAWALRQSACKKRLVRFAYEDANLRESPCIHVLCQPELDQVRAFGLRNPVAIIPNGVDLPPPESDAADPAPAEWHGRRIALFLSRLHPKKGLDELIPAFARCDPDRHGWALAIAGPDEGGYEAVLRRQIAAAGSPFIRLVGPQYGPAKDAWLRRADLFVLPSFSEGFPIALLEALAAGVPALMTPACNFPECERAGAAITVAPERHALADGLRRFWAMSSEARRDMGQRGHQLVARGYTWPNVAAQMLAVYRWTLGQGDQPSCVVKA